jgi:hypothetical protein
MFTQELHDLEVKEAQPVTFAVQVSSNSADVSWHKVTRL